MVVSRLEELLLSQLVDDYGMPAPEREWRFHPQRRWRFDFAWVAKRLAVEVEGGIWSRGRHTRASGFRADLEKYNTAGVLGWLVLRFDGQAVETGAAARIIQSVWASRAVEEVH